MNRLIKSYEAMQEMTKAISRGNLSALGMMGHGKGKKMSSFGRKKRLK